jgi:Na+/citrate or Na+/malate symporter
LCLIVYFFCRLKINHDDSHEFILEFGTVANNVNDVCAIVIACVGRKEGKKRGKGYLVREPKVGQLTRAWGQQGQKSAAVYK